MSHFTILGKDGTFYMGNKTDEREIDKERDRERNVEALVLAFSILSPERAIS